MLCYTVNCGTRYCYVKNKSYLIEKNIPEADYLRNFLKCCKRHTYKLVKGILQAGELTEKRW